MIRLVAFLVPDIVLLPTSNVVAVDQAKALTMLTPYVNCSWTYFNEVNAWFTIHFWHELMSEIFQAWPNFPFKAKSHSIIIVPVELLFLFCKLFGSIGMLRRLLSIESLRFNLPFSNRLELFIFLLIYTTRENGLLFWVWHRYFYDLGTYFRLIIILKQEF